MIRTEQLMLGDWVKYTNPPYMKIAAITRKKIGYHLAPNEPRMHYVRLCEVSAIPVTEEILERNGIKYEHTNVWRYYSRGDGTHVKVELNHWEDDIWEVFIENHYTVMNSWRTISIERCNLKVHELQHCLRLAGVNKEIDLW